MRRTTDAIHLIRIANPVPKQDLLPLAPEFLLEEIISMPEPQPERRRRLRRRILLPAVALVALTATATAWAITRQPEQTTAIACNGQNIIPARTGDPIADCAAELARMGIAHGELEVFTNEFGGVAVYEAELDVPDGAQPLDDAFLQDVAIIELEASLADIVTGLDADCYSTDEARPIVERQIEAVGLDFGIEVGLDEDGARRIADGSSTCAHAIVQPETESVILVSLGGPVNTGTSEDEPPWIAISQQMVQHLDAECLALDEAVMFAEKLFTQAAAEDSRNTATVSGTVDNSVSCSRVDITVGGSVFVDVRGPDGQ